MTDSSRRPLALRTLDARVERANANTFTQLVNELRTLGGTRLFAPPLEWAVRAGFEIVLVETLPADHEWDGTTVFHVHLPDRGWRGWGEYQGLGRAQLVRRGIQCSPSNVRHLAFLLAVPVEVRGLGVERIARAQPHCPREVIREAVHDLF